MSAAAEILRELVAIPSVSWMSNRPLVDAVETRLHDAGWQTRKFAYTDDAGVEKVNLIGRPAGQDASDPEVDLAWLCHSDTVPFAPEWSEATELRERDGLLYGCGACDVKGSLACVLAAAASVRPEEIRRSVALIVTADEEVGCVGTQRLLATGAIRPRRLIVSEPTSLAPAVAGKGYGLAEVRVRGREAHSAFPGRGTSAVRVAGRLIAEIYAQLSAGGCQNALFDPPQTTVNVGLVQGGTAKNVIAGECRFLVEWRPIPEDDAAGVGDVLRTLGRAAEREAPGSAVAVEVRRAEPGFRMPGGGLAQELAAMLGTGPVGIAFSSEASRWKDLAEEMVVLGPGDMETAHSTRECVSRVEMERWVTAIKELLRR